jgi:hypothetical protein
MNMLSPTELRWTAHVQVTLRPNGRGQIDRPVVATGAADDDSVLDVEARPVPRQEKPAEVESTTVARPVDAVQKVETPRDLTRPRNLYRTYTATPIAAHRPSHRVGAHLDLYA